MNEKTPAVELVNVSKSYRMGPATLEVLKNIHYRVERGTFAALLGSSGSGKTTLLNIIGTLETPDSGEVSVNGMNYRTCSAGELNLFRNRTIGFVFQSYALLPELTILENVMLPAMISGTSRSSAHDSAARLLDMMGLRERIRHRPTELSGGEQQRTAIARALVNAPSLLLADEPTGNLDAATGNRILDLFGEIRAQRPELTMVMITHNPEIAARADAAHQLSELHLSSETTEVTFPETVC